MELIEREGGLSVLESHFQQVSDGEGHCVFVNGEAGIGKTSLVKEFCKKNRNRYKIYQGTCDALFTPRPLAPLHDIALQLRKDFWQDSGDTIDRTKIFSQFFYELGNKDEVSVIVFEDIHWADEATLDFIKFLGRRITQLHCLFILTYRDNEIHSHHPLRNVLGQLPPDSFTRLQLTPLSKEAVKKMAAEKGYNGEDVYSISGGNPFYVTEILSSYSKGVPESIKDTVLSVYNRTEEKTREVWDLMSVIPNSLHIKYLEKFDPSYLSAIEICVDAKILIINEGLLFFKHELFRRTIESSLSPLKRVLLNKKVLELLQESFEQNKEIERIIHYAKNANEYEVVLKYVPAAAKQAKLMGSHIEAAKLYLTAIEYYQGNDKEVLLQFYQAYAYECYLTNQIKEAIIFEGKSLQLLKRGNDLEKIGNSMRFLSRLWWFDGNRKKAENFATQAIDILEQVPSCNAKAMAYSNLSQLKMLSDQPVECIYWGEKAISMAKELGNEEILSHALNNVGDVQIRIQSSQQKGIDLLQESLAIALRNSYPEHIARAYTNIGHNGIVIKEYELAKKALDAGVLYCEEWGLDSWTTYMLSSKARLYLEMGKWNEAMALAEQLIKNEELTPVVKIGTLIVSATIKMRRGDDTALPLLIEAKEMALETMELQRIIPTLVAMLEYEWITGSQMIDQSALDNTIEMVERMGNIYENSEFAFWLWKARNVNVSLQECYEGYSIGNPQISLKASKLWEQSGCFYMQALALFQGNDDNKRKAITIIHEMGANAVYEKMKMEMRNAGIKSIPRGIRKATQENPAFLTGRELDVLLLLKEGLQNKEIAGKLFISAKTVDHHISSILFKLDVNTRAKAVHEAVRMAIIK